MELPRQIEEVESTRRRDPDFQPSQQLTPLPQSRFIVTGSGSVREWTTADHYTCAHRP